MPYDFGKHKEKRMEVKQAQQESPKMQAMRRRLGQYSSKQVTPPKGNR